MDKFKKRRSGGSFGGDRKGGFSSRSNDRSGGFRSDNNRSFGERSSFSGRSDDRRSNGDRPSFGRDSRGGFNKRFDMHSAVCAKCKSSCEVPFRPYEGQDVYCNNCFSKDGQSPKASNNSPKSTTTEVPLVLKLELNQIHSKIDKILSIVQKLIERDMVPEKFISEEIKKDIEEIQKEVKKVKDVKEKKFAKVKKEVKKKK